MTRYSIISRTLCAFAAACCCTACMDVDNSLGANLVPSGQNYSIYYTEKPITEIRLAMTDGLSGYSPSRFTVGVVKDPDFGTTTRSCALTLVPLFSESLDLGKDPVFHSFHFTAVKEATHCPDESQSNILQHFNVYELSKPLDFQKDFDCNMTVEHNEESISEDYILYNGKDSLSFNFTREFGEKYLRMTNDDVRDMDDYLKKFPGIYIEADTADGSRYGRINMFNLQLGFNGESQTVTGNFAILNFNSSFEGVRKDTSLLFYFSATDFYKIDSLLTYSGTGNFPQYGLNLTSQSTRSLAGSPVGRTIPIEGGGGIKPVISARHLKNMAEEEIIRNGGNPSEAIINKASLVFPFEFPADYKEVDNRWPEYLSPTVKVRTDTNASFVGLTDSSSETENPGNINRSLCRYAPDITYHMQRILGIDEKDSGAEMTKMLNDGSFDIWFLIMATETITTTNSVDQATSEYYNYLAYQNYYNNMYGGYGGYGGYGDSYSNYYNYMMMSAYANQSNTTTTSSVMLDISRFYKASLNGPGSDNAPRLELTYSLPNKD